MPRSFHRSLLTLLLALASLTAHSAPTIALRVRPLRPAGGVERDLPTRLTVALTRFLHDHAESTVRIETPTRTEQAVPRDTLLHYTLEGDLSYASDSGDDSGRYLLVARLTREGRPPALIGQWAGSANTLRYLTANLRNDPRVHTLGLIGEIGSRVLVAVTTDAASPEQQWRSLTNSLLPLRTPKLTTSVSGNIHTNLITGTQTRLRLQPPTNCRAYLLTCCAGGRLEATQLTWTSQHTGTDRTESQILTLPADTQEAWLLYQGTTSGKAAFAFPVLALSRNISDEDDAPVHVLNGIGKITDTAQEALRLLLTEIQHDPHNWYVLRLNVAPHP